MFQLRASASVRNRGLYLAVADDIATTDDHGALLNIMRAATQTTSLAFKSRIPGETCPTQNRFVYLYTRWV